MSNTERLEQARLEYERALKEVRESLEQAKLVLSEIKNERHPNY